MQRLSRQTLSARTRLVRLLVALSGAFTRHAIHLHRHRKWYVRACKCVYTCRSAVRLCPSDLS